MLPLFLGFFVAHWLGLATAVHTGFCYGAMWDDNTPKTYEDFKRAFISAKTLEDVPVPFDSARLFTTIQHGTTNQPISAIQAAIDTKTTLLLGIWLSINIDGELKALDIAFEKHKQALADLVVGISVGNEDLYRGSNACREKNKDKTPCAMAATREEVKGNITLVREHIKKSAYAELLKDKPIGHTDVVAEAYEHDVDFVGMNAYPYWNRDAIGEANTSYWGSIDFVKKKAGDTMPVWLTELGWPMAGVSQEGAVASEDNMQKFWTDVGCSLFGRFNLWWFELERDTWQDNIDWGVIDVKTRKPRIKFSCPGKDTAQPGEYPKEAEPSNEPKAEAPPSPSIGAGHQPPATPTTLLTQPSASNPLESPDTGRMTTQAATNPPSSTSTTYEQPPLKTVTITLATCITVYDAGNGTISTLTTNIFTNQPCASPPPITLSNRNFSTGSSTLAAALPSTPASGSSYLSITPFSHAPPPLSQASSTQNTTPFDQSVQASSPAASTAGSDKPVQATVPFDTPVKASIPV